MADWLKVRHALVRSAKIRGLMRALRCRKHVALGVALNWLVWLDEQTEDGLTHLSPDELDEEIGFRGCTEAMISIGWAVLGSDGCVEAVEFGKHCGESAKARAEHASRQAKYRVRHRCDSKGDSKGDGGGDVFLSRDASPEENRIEKNNKGVCYAVVDGGAGALPDAPVPQSPALPGRGAGDAGGAVGGAAGGPSLPPSSNDDDGFRVWLAALCGAHPSCSRSRVLAPDVEAAAWDAYRRFPQAAQQAELMAAYYADRLQEDRRGKRFYRPQAQRWFFEQLEDVMGHAERWAREARWKPKSKRKAARAAKGGKGAEAPCCDGAAASEADVKRWFDALRADVRSVGAADAGAEADGSDFARAFKDAMK